MEKVTSKERHQEYDRHRRDKKAKAFYGGASWRATRARVLARDVGMDIYLYITTGAVVPANTVHHITELSEDWEQRYNPENLISVSEATHSMLSIAYKDAAKRQQMQEALRQCMAAWQRVRG